MTLDEAIKHATEVADRYDEIIKTNNHGWGFNGSDENCVRCANEHRQLAEWLIELKERRGAEPEPLSDAYMKAVQTWLLDYQIRAAELKGRYTAYEVLLWVVNDWRKEHERPDQQAGSDKSNRSARR